MREFIKIHPFDNVMVALRDFSKDEIIEVNDQRILVKEKVKRGHKIAIQFIATGGNVVKYGYPIGQSTQDISIGSHVHVHNVKTGLSDKESYVYQPIKQQSTELMEETRVFNGYYRKNGKVGIRNELWIVPSVGCVNGIAELILKNFKERLGGDISPFESTLVLKHNYGCSQLGDDHVNTRKVLADFILHPNAGGVLVLGLGCENNTLIELEQELGAYDTDRIRFLRSQDVEDEVEAGIEALLQIYEHAKLDRRKPVPISELKIGLKCGGSDGLSGITANPLLGKLSDFLIQHGGTTVLTEVPEMFGAERILMGRAKNEETFEKIVDLINEYKQYFIKHDQPIYENPSPGNKEGGISTLEDKSLGCTQKAGVGTVIDVLKYGGRLEHNGLNLLSAPGNDLVSCTALAASGCHMVLFTTGRGTPFGTIVPTVKISSNTALYEKKKHWIDFDAGVLLQEETEQVVNHFIDYLIEVASGKIVNNEKNDFKELAIFKSGVTL